MRVSEGTEGSWRVQEGPEGSGRVQKGLRDYKFWSFWESLGDTR